MHAYDVSCNMLDWGSRHKTPVRTGSACCLRPWQTKAQFKFGRDIHKLNAMSKSSDRVAQSPGFGRKGGSKVESRLISSQILDL